MAELPRGVYVYLVLPGRGDPMITTVPEHATQWAEVCATSAGLPSHILAIEAVTDILVRPSERAAQEKAK